MNTNAVVKEMMTARILEKMISTPKGAYDHAIARHLQATAMDQPYVRSAELEAVILEDWGCARKYADKVIGGRWAEFEARVEAAEPEHNRASIEAVMTYAKTHVPERWVAAEKHVATDEELSLRYAIERLGKPFEADHPAHAKLLTSAVGQKYLDIFPEIEDPYKKPILMR
jgi:hypothetical protein